MQFAQNVGELFPYKSQSFTWQKSGEVINSLHLILADDAIVFFIVLFYHMSPSKKHNQNVL